MSLISRSVPPSTKLERKIIIGMITNDNYLSKIRKIYTNKSLRISFTKLIADWCVDFYDRYSKAPMREIEDIFASKQSRKIEEKDAELITNFLTEINEEYQLSDKLNVQYLIDNTEKYFRTSNLIYLNEMLGKALIAGDIEVAESTVKKYERIVIPEAVGVDLLRSKEEISATFNENNKNTLLEFPGNIGEMIGKIERDYVVTFVANAGIGKSWFLQQSGLWAAMSGLNTLVISLEMGLQQYKKRLYPWLTGQPMKEQDLMIPTWDCHLNQTGNCPYKNIRASKVSLHNKKTGNQFPKGVYPDRYVPCTKCMNVDKLDEKRHVFKPSTYFKIEHRNALDEITAIKKLNKFNKFNKRSGVFVVKQMLPGTTVDDIRTIIDNASDYDGIDYDIVVIDYNAKMGSTKRWGEKRHVLNDIAVEVKALAIERHIAIITAHQGNGSREQGRDLERGSLQESVGILNESDLLILINQNVEDNDLQRYRIKMGKVRDDEFNMSKICYVLNCLKIGKPVIDSYTK